MIISHKRCYKEARLKEYPPIGDQLDAVYKLAKALQGAIELPPDVLKWIADIDEVKTKFKKE